MRLFLFKFSFDPIDIFKNFYYEVMKFADLPFENNHLMDVLSLLG